MSCILCKLGYAPHSGAPPRVLQEICVHYSVHQKRTCIFAHMTPILCFRAIIPRSSKKKSVTYSVNWGIPFIMEPYPIYRQKSVFIIVFIKTLHTFLLIWHLFYVHGLSYPFPANKKKCYIFCKLGYTLYNGALPNISPEIGVHYSVHTKHVHTFLLMWHLFYILGLSYPFPAKNGISKINHIIYSHTCPNHYHEFVHVQLGHFQHDNYVGPVKSCYVIRLDCTA